MQENIELDQRILQKNLEITKLTARIDSLTSDLFKPFFINVLQETHELIISLNKDGYNEDVNSLLADLRKVIRFMRHKKAEEINNKQINN